MVKTQKTYAISVPPRSPTTAIHAALGALDSAHYEVSIMAGSLIFAAPQEVCGLRALLDYAAIQTDSVRFDCPTDPNVHNYLARMNFYEGLPSNVALSRPAPTLRRQNRRRNLVELCRIESTEDVENLMDGVWNVAQGQFGSGAMAKACATALGAATENVVDHAESPIGALVAAQRYERRGLELAVVDLGLGIPTTLRRNALHRGLSDLEAVQQALVDGVSSSQQVGRGAGLTELVATVRRARASTLAIQSGRAHLTISFRGGHQTSAYVTPADAVLGTWIFIRLEQL